MATPLRLAELDPADQYFLDCANENDELDGTSYLTLRLFGDRDELYEIIDPVSDWFNTRPCYNGWRDRHARCERLAKAADRVLTQITPSEAGGLIWTGCQRMPKQLLDAAEVFAYMAYEDATTVGCMEPFHYRGIDHNDEPTKKVVRRLHAPRFIRKYVRDQRETKDHRRNVDRMMERVKLVPLEYMRDTTFEIEIQLAMQHKAERERRWSALLERDRETSLRHEPLVRLKKGALQGRNERRKILRRAASTAMAVIGRERVSALAQGRQIEIAGRDIKLLVQPRGSLARCGHGRLSVAVADMFDTKLGELCVYFDNTPALDQVTALALNVEGGYEQEVLKTANLTFVTQAGRDHPLLGDRAKGLENVVCPPDAPQSQVFDATTGRRVRNRTKKQDLQKSYWQKTKSLWIDAVCSQVFPDRSSAKPMIDMVMATV